MTDYDQEQEDGEEAGPEERDDDDLLEPQQGNGYGEDEGERAAALPE